MKYPLDKFGLRQVVFEHTFASSHGLGSDKSLNARVIINGQSKDADIAFVVYDHESEATFPTLDEAVDYYNACK